MVLYLILLSGSGMGANGSSEGRLKSRSQSSSALYCIGKSGNGSIIEAQSNYGNHNPYSNCHSTAANGLSSSIPADIWDLPCTAKSYSPVGTTKQNRQNINHYYPENYHLDSYLSSGGSRGRPGTTATDAEATATTGSHNSQVGHPGAELAIGPNSSTTATNIVPAGQVSSRSGKKEKGWFLTFLTIYFPLSFSFHTFFASISSARMKCFIVNYIQ